MLSIFVQRANDSMKEYQLLIKYSKDLLVSIKHNISNFVDSAKYIKQIN